MTSPRQLVASVRAAILTRLTAVMIVIGRALPRPRVSSPAPMTAWLAKLQTFADRVLARLGVTSVRALVRDLVHRLMPVFAIALLVVSMGGSWRLAGATPPTIAEEIAASSPPEPQRPVKKSGRALTGKINLNTATEEQLMLLPTVGPAKAERIVHWRKKNGGFRRTADLRRVKGFGFKTYKRLEPFLAIKGDTTLK